MRKNRYISLFCIALVALMATINVTARDFNDKLMNRPYADMRAWHLGFSVGLHTQDVNFTNNGFVTENGESWFAEQPAFSPGFCVNGLVDLRLNDYFNVRLTPGMYFGNRDFKMREATTGAIERQNVKSADVVLPIDLKYSAMRYRNARPYLVGGVMPTFDVTKRRSEALKFKPFDLYLTVGFGCDFYLPFFKFNPEIKFCFGLIDVIDKNRPDLSDDPDKLKFTQSISKATSQMMVLTFYFE
ncbi:MAG: PorT family protein [Muribaculaceae bacterium]|nr:PorT family protein [Muribaculaceae bacterium]